MKGAPDLSSGSIGRDQEVGRGSRRPRRGVPHAPAPDTAATEPRPAQVNSATSWPRMKATAMNGAMSATIRHQAGDVARAADRARGHAVGHAGNDQATTIMKTIELSMARSEGSPGLVAPGGPGDETVQPGLEHLVDEQAADHGEHGGGGDVGEPVGDPGHRRAGVGQGRLEALGDPGQQGVQAGDDERRAVGRARRREGAQQPLLSTRSMPSRTRSRGRNGCRIASSGPWSTHRPVGCREVVQVTASR